MRRQLRRDLVLATSSDVVRKLLGYVVLATLARFLSKSDMGELFFAMTFASVFALLTELGTSRYLTRRIAEDERNALQDLSEVLALRLPAVGVAFLLLSVIAQLFMPARSHILIPVGLFVLVGDLYFSFGALFVGLRRMGYRFVTGLIDIVLLAFLVVVAVRLGWGLPGVLVCYVVAKVALVIGTALVVQVRFGSFRIVANADRLRTVALASRPFFVLVFLSLVFLKVDTLMLLFLRSSEDVAQYEAGYKFFEISRFVVRSSGMVFFPLCAQLVGKGEWARLDRLTRKLLLGTGVLGSAFAALGIGLAPVVVPWVWGTDYTSTIPIVRVLLLGVPCLYLTYVATFVAQALHIERTVVYIMAAAVIFNVAMNLVAIPSLGALGAAWTTVAGEGLLAGVMVWVVVRGTAKRRRALVPVEHGT